jgi:hypothetical protein
MENGVSFDEPENYERNTTATPVGPAGMLASLIALHVVKDAKGAERLLLMASTGLLILTVFIYLTGNNVFRPQPVRGQHNDPVFNVAHTP